ncbi:hypothetical protein PFISCL1PPCAC_20794, partial [Pristionchus fissidentatus]
EETVAFMGVTVKGIEDEEAAEGIGATCSSIDLVCVGACDGQIGGWCTTRHGLVPLRVQSAPFDAVGEMIEDIDVQVFEPLTRADNDKLEFGIRLYTLTARRVTVNALRVTVTTSDVTVSRVS